MTTQSSAQQRCPLCGAANLCAIASGKRAQSCWCMDITIPQQLIARAKQRSGEKACICQACAQHQDLATKEAKREQS